MNSKNLICIAIFTAVLSGCSTDIVVKSDLGESSIVKESAVTSYVFDKDKAIKNTEKFWKRWKILYKKCVAELMLGSSYCDNKIGVEVARKEVFLKAFPEMPDITIVKYRTIDTNINGDKTASGYKYVACIPEGSADNQDKWFDIVSSIDGGDNKDIESNLLNDGNVVSSVRIKVCERYGNI